MDDELRAKVEEMALQVASMKEALDRYLPLLEAYLDPNQEGPRGWMMRRQLAKSNGRTHA